MSNILSLDIQAPMKGFKQIPGPRSFPVIGNVLGYQAPEVGRNPLQSLKIWKHLNETYGPLVRLEVEPRSADRDSRAFSYPRFIRLS